MRPCLSVRAEGVRDASCGSVSVPVSVPVIAIVSSVPVAFVTVPLVPAVPIVPVCPIVAIPSAVIPMAAVPVPIVVCRDVCRANNRRMPPVARHPVTVMTIRFVAAGYPYMVRRRLHARSLEIHARSGNAHAQARAGLGRLRKKDHRHENDNHNCPDFLHISPLFFSCACHDEGGWQLVYRGNGKG